MSLGGSAKEDRDASLRVAQLTSVLSGEKVNNKILNLVDVDLLRGRLLEDFRKNARPGTVKLYLHSL